MIKENTLTAEEFHQLFTSVGWEAPSLEQIQVALNNSLCSFSIYEESKLVGMARLLGDYAMSYYVKDFAILPDAQGKGVGRKLMEYVIQYIENQIDIGWGVSLELISSKGNEKFYSKFGFEERPCEWDSSGMFRMIFSNK